MSKILPLPEAELALMYRRMPLNAKLIPNQFIPYAKHLADTGQRPYALELARDHLFATLRAQQPSRVVYQPPDKAFNGAGAWRNRYH